MLAGPGGPLVHRARPCAAGKRPDVVLVHGDTSTAMEKMIHSESEIVKSVNELESQLKRLKELEEENSKLKRMYANLALDNEILREEGVENGRKRVVDTGRNFKAL